MKKLSRLMLVLCLVVVFAFTACTSTTPTPSPDDGEQQTATVTGLEFEQARQEFSLGEDFTSEGLRVLKVMSDGTKPVVAPRTLPLTAPLTTRTRRAPTPYASLLPALIFP